MEKVMEKVVREQVVQEKVAHKSALQLRDVTVQFQRGAAFSSLRERVTALKNVSLEIAVGSIMGIVGESGSGKSTLARVVAGSVKPTTGRLFLFEDEISWRSKKEFSSVRLVFQDPLQSFNPRLTIQQQLNEIARYVKGAASAAQEDINIQIERVGLTDAMLQRYPHQVSQGQLQRFSIARALLSKPKLLLFDESLSSLDVAIQVQVLTLLKKLQMAGDLTYLFISHDLRLIDALCDEIAVMFQGEIVEQGSKYEVFNNPQAPYTKKIMSSLF